MGTLRKEIKEWIKSLVFAIIVVAVINTFLHLL